jgi:CheY-like chemotaxis protein
MAEPSAGRTPLRLLLAEDSEDDAELLNYRLQKAGFTVDLLRVDSEAGLMQALGQGPWDLVLSDHNMPGFSGARVLALVRSLDPSLPFMFVSANPSEENAAERLRSGVAHSFNKGKLEGLPAAIHAVLALARQQP